MLIKALPALTPRLPKQCFSFSLCCNIVVHWQAAGAAGAGAGAGDGATAAAAVSSAAGYSHTGSAPLRVTSLE